MFPRSLVLLIVAAFALVAGALLLIPRLKAPRLSERVTAEAIHAAVQREADTTFIVTGYLEVVATVRSQDTRVLLPDFLNLPLGTTRATVRVPGRVSYGFDISQLTPRMIRVSGDTVVVEIPPVTIYSTEPDLSRLEVETTTGWARRPVTAQEAERRAVQLLSSGLEQQGEAHLARSAQPRVNTARALRRMLEPVVTGLGMERPHVRVNLGAGLVLEQ
ncbi:MAG: DUF4230 domain-containing protein [Gemmatimonadetes bacterium]|nr:DUF4230 domain-containing protein [Gemmatimonadota bacterium]